MHAVVTPDPLDTAPPEIPLANVWTIRGRRSRSAAAPGWAPSALSAACQFAPQNLPADRLPRAYLHRHHETWVNRISSQRVWTSKCWMGSDGVTLPGGRNLADLVQLQHVLRKQVNLLPCPVIDV